jgi:hypothetical protein
MINPVRSLGDLRSRARVDARYAQLAVRASHNLGGPAGDDLNAALHWLDLNALETNEQGVVDEVNFMRGPWS